MLASVVWVGVYVWPGRQSGENVNPARAYKDNPLIGPVAAIFVSRKSHDYLHLTT